MKILLITPIVLLYACTTVPEQPVSLNNCVTVEQWEKLKERVTSAEKYCTPQKGENESESEESSE